jgi:single-strand DNA-binding protein
MVFNKVILIGNLTRDPEIRYNPSGKAVATLSIAVNRRSRQGEEGKDDVSFFDVVVWEKQAETCGQYLSKGSGVLVEGRLQQRRWETEDGQKRSKVEVVASNVQFMPKRQQGGEAGPDAAIDEGDIPF